LARYTKANQIKSSKKKAQKNRALASEITANNFRRISIDNTLSTKSV